MILITWSGEETPFLLNWSRSFLSIKSNTKLSFLKSNIGDAEGACADWQKASENKNERATLWVQENCLPNISEDFLKNTENKVLIANARRKYAAGELRESCNYYEQAKMNGYKAPNLSWKLKLKFITDPMCFIF